jgi:hypothetical protein
LAEAEATEAGGTEEEVMGERATEEVASTVLRVMALAVIGAVITSRVMALADTISFDDTLLSTEVAVIILRAVALADTALHDDTMRSTAAMVGPAITLQVTALVAIVISVA